MSNYLKATKDPITGVFEIAEWMDNFFAPHHYGVRFPDGNIYDPEKIELETQEQNPTSPSSSTDDKCKRCPNAAEDNIDLCLYCYDAEMLEAYGLDKP